MNQSNTPENGFKKFLRENPHISGKTGALSNTQKKCCYRCRDSYDSNGMPFCNYLYCPCHTTQNPTKTVDTPSEPSMGGHTPPNDVEEWEVSFDKQFSSLDLNVNTGYGATDLVFNMKDAVKDFITTLLTSRDTYWKERVEKLWGMLDDIDSVPDMLHPNTERGHESTWRMMVAIAEKRHKILKTDGFTLTPITDEDNLK